MQDFRGKCAVITGGSGLLGHAMAEAFAKLGMNIVVADISEEAMARTVATVEALGCEALAIRTDVSNPAEMDALAEAAYASFQQVNLLCLNAGRTILKPLLQLTRDDWDAVLSVQFGGVLNGVLSFLPRLVAQGGERHIVITSSMSGVGRADLRPLNAPYVTAKFAAVGLAEVMAPVVKTEGIGLSVLCPGMTVADPDACRGVEWPMASAAYYEGNILSATQVAEEVVRGIREGRLHIFPHRKGRLEVIKRHMDLMEAFDQAERTSPPLE